MAKKKAQADEVLEASGEETVDETVEATTEPSSEVSERMVSIHLSHEVSINGKHYSGEVTVPEHVARDLAAMSSLKQRRELEVHIGKKYEVDRLLNSGARTREVGKV